ncbi:MAG TPA: bestrophin family ion channel [Oculatellaceae cyanobacterium]
MGWNIWSGVLTTVLTVLLSIAGLLLVRRLSANSNFKEHHDVADPMLSTVGTLFAILLGFMVANAMQRFEEARVNVQQEANAVMDLYRLAEGLPSAKCDNLRLHLKQYNEAIIKDEWLKLSQKQTSDVAYKYYDLAWTDCATFKPTEDAHNNLQQKILDCITTLSDCRRTRIYAMHNGLAPALWPALFTGGIATIFFTYLFKMHNFQLQILMTSLVTLAICLNLFLLASFDYPFSGDVRVTPLPFEMNESAFNMMESAGHSPEVIVAPKTAPAATPVLGH